MVLARLNNQVQRKYDSNVFPLFTQFTRHCFVTKAQYAAIL